MPRKMSDPDYKKIPWTEERKKAASDAAKERAEKASRDVPQKPHPLVEILGLVVKSNSSSGLSTLQMRFANSYIKIYHCYDDILLSPEEARYIAGKLYYLADVVEKSNDRP